jgi:copper chaperone CopZ
MIKHLITILTAAALTSFASAETTVKITGVHLCCKSCVTGVEKAVAKAKGVTVAVDKDACSVTLTATDKSAAQAGVDALVAAGYFGKTDSSDVSLKDTSGAKDAKVSSLTVHNVHLCCGKCVTAVTKALQKVKGVTGSNAEKGAESFEVKGDFSPKEVFDALQGAGLTGKAGS